jgi:hypothetical protein
MFSESYRRFLNLIFAFELPVVLYGCEMLSLTLREEHRRGGGVDNKVLRRIFGPKRDEVTRGRRKLHNEELHNL